MKKLPLILFIVGCLLSITGVLVDNELVDFSFTNNPTYLKIYLLMVISKIEWMGLFLIYSSIIYFILNRKAKIKKLLIIVHIFLSLIIIYFILIRTHFIFNAPRRYYSHGDFDEEKYMNDISIEFEWLLVLFVFLQLIPFINFYISKKR